MFNRQQIVLSFIISLLTVIILTGCSGSHKNQITDINDNKIYRKVHPYMLPDDQNIVFPDTEPTKIVYIQGNVPGVDFSTWQKTGVSLMTNDVLFIKAENDVCYVTQTDRF